MVDRNLREIGDEIVAKWYSPAYNQSREDFLFVELHDANISDYFKGLDYDEIGISNTNNPENMIKIINNKGKTAIKIRHGAKEEEIDIDDVNEAHVKKHGSRVNISIKRK